MTSPSNPPAFPFSVMTYQPDHPDSPRYTTNWHEGMNLRDYFAAKAMQGLLSNPKLAPHILKQGGAHGGWIEGAAYGWADAMLKERDAQT